jgi:hypothetical protein
MKTLRVLLFLGLSITLMACGEKKHNVPLERAETRETTGAGINPVGTPSAPDLSLTGRVYATLNAAQYNSDPTLQDDFMDGIRGFVSATDNPYAYGFVSGNPSSSSSTGIYFGGVLAWSANQLVVSDSFLAMEIRDQFTGTKAPNGQVIGAYPVRMPMLNYYYDESKTYELEVIFGDSFGRVTLHGNFIAGYLQGYVSYQNTKKFDGGTPEYGILGSFKIPTCDFTTGVPGCPR